MYPNSIVSNYLSSQPGSLWNDGHEHKVSSKGMPSITNLRNLSNYAEELVAYYGLYNGDEYVLSFVKLDAHEQTELARLYLEVNDRETTECIYDGDFRLNNDFNIALISMLKNNTRETREEFSRITIQNIIKYYAISLQEILDDACVSYHSQIMNEHNYFQTQDNEHGDITWSKF